MYPSLMVVNGIGKKIQTDATEYIVNIFMIYMSSFTKCWLPIFACYCHDN